MSRASRPILLVGGVQCDTADEVFRTVASAVGDLAVGLTDGEIGLRRMWIFYVLINTWTKHPDLLISRTSPEGGTPPPWIPDEFRPWFPAGYHDFPWIAVRDGVETLTPIDTLGYPGEALESYRLFCRLRDQGVIPANARFQQSLPFPDDAVRLFTNSAGDMSLMVDAYIDVMKRDVTKLCEQIPHDDLVIQWDVNWETIAIEHGDHIPDAPPMQFKPDGDAMARHERYIRELNAVIPEGVTLGLHLCYGNLNYVHFRDPVDLSTSVAIANRSGEVSAHAIDFIQMSVPQNRNDDAFFEPLRDLKLADTAIYAGLIHYDDGVEGSVRRLKTFQRHFHGPTGISTECGLGRLPEDQDLKTLLEIHREVAACI